MQYSDSEDEYKYESTSSSDNNYLTDNSNKDYCLYTKASKGSLSIIQYFTKQASQIESEAAIDIESSASDNSESESTQEDEIDINDNNNFTKQMEALEEKNMICKDAASDAAKRVFNKGPYRARIINRWTKSWIENSVLPVSLQSCHQKIKLFIDNKNVIEKKLEFIHKNEEKIIPKLYRSFINDTLFLQMEITALISEKTVRVWITFLKKIEEFEQLIPIFEGNDMEQKNPIPLDESSFHKKGQEKSIMIIHSNSITIFAFDYSTNHRAMADNALCAQHMNLNPGGEQPVMKDIVFETRNIAQSMVFSSDHPKYPNKSKGIKQVLIERGLWHNGLHLDCQLYFLAQKSELETVIEKAGHRCIFYPKFHCELNFIEMYWGAAKRYMCEYCDYTWNGLQKTVPEALNSISLIKIRWFAQKSWRYMDIYRKGVTGKLAIFAEKKYKSHRRVSDDILNQINEILLKDDKTFIIIMIKNQIKK
ncbi:hypothetical protein C1645_838829 [Glomus cerebriforme]|uniref:Uncharacterized protein n=1 Tax=Glomus cerebriforme TaxID=658196 RepID=A0A397S1Q5_9GLOM|nr:hypothetical protein C1645_838829 [Glomus cerebriforme]